MRDKELLALEVLSERVGNFPRSPGVYLMRDGGNTVIYVGKAKDLRARVKTYFLGGDGRVQIEALLNRVNGVEHIVTENEEQAFVLERDLITKYKPRYNIKLKDDKSFLSIRLDTEAPWPRLELVRRRNMSDDGARYFGPYSSSIELKSVLEIVKRVIPLRSCNNAVFYNRQRPCLEYQIKRCAGPCCLPVDPEQYRQWVKQAIEILQGRTEKLISDLRVQMDRAAEETRFEDAAILRDRIDVLESFKRGQSLNTYSGEDRDVFAIYREEGLAALSVLKVRNGRLSDTDNFTFTELAVSDAEILEASIEQYYAKGRDIPPEIVVPIEPGNLSIVEGVLTQKTGKAIVITMPQRGIKSRLLALAETNARHFFSSTFDSDTRYQEVASSLAHMLKLRQIPRKIECVDISNFQGSDNVGALVSFFDGVPQKKSYRTYRIKTTTSQDDFAAIFEVVSRRLSRGLAEGDIPDLLVIDGGAAQLMKAIEAREFLKVDVDIIALAKQRTESNLRSKEIERSSERIFLLGHELPITLPDDSEVTHFLQRLRDETHRFVIGFHRRQRTKRVIRSALDDILGLGPERRGRLLRHFGSVEKIKIASADDVARIGRMPKPLAEKVLRTLGADPVRDPG